MRWLEPLLQLAPDGRGGGSRGDRGTPQRRRSARRPGVGTTHRVPARVGLAYEVAGRLTG